MICFNLYDSDAVPYNPEVIVIYCDNLETSRDFYALLGLNLRGEKHGTGPAHYSFWVDERLFELYPTKAHRKFSKQTLVIKNHPLRRMIINNRVPQLLEHAVRKRWDRREERYMTHVLDPDGNRLIIKE